MGGADLVLGEPGPDQAGPVIVVFQAPYLVGPVLRPSAHGSEHQGEQAGSAEQNRSVGVGRFGHAAAQELLVRGGQRVTPERIELGQRGWRDGVPACDELLHASVEPVLPTVKCHAGTDALHGPDARQKTA